MGYDIECKQNNIVNYPAIISDNIGVVNLLNKQVKLILENESKTLSYIITCDLGCSYNNKSYTAEQGGITIPFTKTETAVAGLLKGEFVIYDNITEFRVPQNNKFLTIMIYSSLDYTPSITYVTIDGGTSSNTDPLNIIDGGES